MGEHSSIDIKRLMSSFQVIEKKQASFTSRFYDRLFTETPEIEKLFQSVGMKMQGRMILQAVRFALDNLTNTDELEVVFSGLGRRHHLYGVKPQYYEKITRAFIETAREYIGPKFDAGLEADWHTVFNKWTTIMKQGVAEKSKEASSKLVKYGRNLESLNDPYLSRFFKGLPKTDEAQNPNIRSDLNRGVTITYLGEKSVEACPMRTILDISHANDIPHICECGGTARCSTCRVMIIDGLDNCLPRSSLEKRLTAKKGFSPEIRLACQTRVMGDITLKRLVKDETDVDAAISGTIAGIGQEIKGAVLFTDIWDFTAFAERNLPYDVIHSLNRLFEDVGQIIDNNEGYVDKYIGDSVMAIFGLDEENAVRTCKNATTAAIQIIENLENVNQYLRQYIGSEFRLSVGLAYGNMVVGELGFSLKKQFTAIGDTVNIAARLQSATRRKNIDLLASADLTKHLISENYDIFNRYEFELKGKSEKVSAYEVRAK